MKKCPNCGRSYSDMVQVCPACNLSLGNDQSGQTVRETEEKPKRETVRAEIVRKETVVSALREKAKMTWAGYIGYVVAALFVCAFFHNLSLFGMEDAIEETVPALFMVVPPFLLLDQLLRAFDDGNIAKAGKMALGMVVWIVLFFVLSM